MLRKPIRKQGVALMIYQGKAPDGPPPPWLRLVDEIWGEKRWVFAPWRTP